jgi:hypothetical protein
VANNLTINLVGCLVGCSALLSPVVAAGSVLLVLPSTMGIKSAHDLRQFSALNVSQIKQLATNFHATPVAPHAISPQTREIIMQEAGRATLPLRYTAYKLQATNSAAQ